ncbi:hypothetical protein EVAR_85797_1 [Eumeta japonica]|uniref:Reverse transcriptase domain-containing protein n=1 Tax=Eumeta variegata TaxID=151549 RepID=A0A4C1UQ81_EUMVA|nr:hypothetical protein EVAR_85797_1 [Eumeta japonica]
MLILSFLEKTFEAWEDKRDAIGVFCDLSKAFDYVNHEIVIRELHHFGVTGRALDLLTSYLTNRVQRIDVNDMRTLSMHEVSSGLIQALKSLYKGSGAYVKTNKAYTDWFDISRGVRQGCVALPQLFYIFVDGCLHNFKIYEYGLRLDKLSVKYILYADEQVILVPSACGLQEIVTEMNDSVKKRVNVSKIKVMVFGRGDSMIKATPVQRLLRGLIT